MSAVEWLMWLAVAWAVWLAYCVADVPTLVSRWMRGHR